MNLLGPVGFGSALLGLNLLIGKASWSPHVTSWLPGWVCLGHGRFCGMSIGGFSSCLGVGHWGGDTIGHTIAVVGINITTPSIFWGILGLGMRSSVIKLSSESPSRASGRVQLYYSGPWFRAKVPMGALTFSKIHHMLFGILGTTSLVLIIVHRLLNIYWAHKILGTCGMRVSVTITRTFNVLVIFGWMRVFRNLTDELCRYFNLAQGKAAWNFSFFLSHLACSG